MTTYTVDTDGTSGDYASLSTAIAAVPATLDDDYTIQCAATTGAADSTAVSIDKAPAGFTLRIEAAAGHEALKTGWSTSRYRLSVADAVAFENRSGVVQVDGLQIERTGTAGIAVQGTQWAAAAEDSIIFDSCRMRSSSNTTGWITFEAYDPDADVTLQNCIITAGAVAVRMLDGVFKFWNNTVYGADIGVYTDAEATSEITNCAVFSCTTDDFDLSGTDTVDHCASDDGDGTNAVAPSGSAWTNEFTDPSGGDFTLLNTGNLYQGGVAISGGPSTDIDGDTWGTPPSIGSDEYASSGPGSFEYTPTGGITIGGSAGTLLNYEFSPSGGITINGSAEVTITADTETFEYTPTGGITISGTASYITRSAGTSSKIQISHRLYWRFRGLTK